MTNTWIHSLTEEWILYTINEHDLKTFKKIASHHEHHVSSYIPPIFQEINIYVTVCNVWFTLHSYEKPYFLDERRRMNYQSAYIQLEYVGRHLGVKQFIQTHQLTKPQQFYFAFFIAMECMQWITTLMEHAQQEEIIAYYMKEENFIQMTNDEASTSFKQTLDFQKIYVKEMMKNLSKTSDFDQAMKRAINQTRQFLLSQPVTQK